MFIAEGWKSYAHPFVGMGLVSIGGILMLRSWFRGLDKWANKIGEYTPEEKDKWDRLYQEGIDNFAQDMQDPKKRKQMAKTAKKVGKFTLKAIDKLKK